MKLTGTISYLELEGGVWVFKADGGRQYQLAGGDRKLKKDGARAEVEGEVRDVFTAQMVGPVFEVKSYRFI